MRIETNHTHLHQTLLRPVFMTTYRHEYETGDHVYFSPDELDGVRRPSIDWTGV
jgi:hypothetical protein